MRQGSWRPSPVIVETLRRLRPARACELEVSVVILTVIMSIGCQIIGAPREQDPPPRGLVRPWQPSLGGYSHLTPLLQCWNTGLTLSAHITSAAASSPPPPPFLSSRGSHAPCSLLPDTGSWRGPVLEAAWIHWDGCPHVSCGLFWFVCLFLLGGALER